MATVNLGVDFIYNGFLMVFCQYFFLYSHLVMYLVYVRFLWYSDKLPRIIVNFVIIAMAEPLLVVILVISFLLVGFLYYLSYKTISPAYAMYYIPPAKRDGLSPVQIGEIVIDAELLAKLLNPTLHTVPRRKVPCTNDIESFIQVFKYKGNKRYERLLYNRKIDYNVHYVYTSFLTRVPNVTLKADERLPDIAMLVRRTLLIYRDMEWQGKETRLINQYLNDLNKDLIPVLVEYYWHLLKEEKLHAEKDFFVLFLLHSQMASFIGLDPTDFEWGRFLPEHLRKLRLYKTWEEYTQEVLRTEPVVEGLFLDYGVRCEYYVRRILANNAEFNRLYALKLRYEAMDKSFHGIKELSYEDEVRYRSLGGWDIMKFYAHAYSYFATIDLEEARTMYHVLSREFDLWRTPKDIGGIWAETEALQEFERESRREMLRKRGLKKN